MTICIDTICTYVCNSPPDGSVESNRDRGWHVWNSSRLMAGQMRGVYVAALCASSRPILFPFLYPPLCRFYVDKCERYGRLVQTSIVDKPVLLFPRDEPL